MLDLEAIKKTTCDPAGIRTQDPYIKSVLLYRLSYGIIKLALVYQMAHAGALGKFSHWPTSFCNSAIFSLYCGAKLS
jgi:hypothetical protein